MKKTTQLSIYDAAMHALLQKNDRTVDDPMPEPLSAVRWEGSTSDSHGKLLNTADSNGNFAVRTRDKHGNMLSLRSSVPDIWQYWERTEDGRELTFSDRYGHWVAVAQKGHQVLRYNGSHYWEFPFFKLSPESAIKKYSDPRSCLTHCFLEDLIAHQELAGHRSSRNRKAQE